MAVYFSKMAATVIGSTYEQTQQNRVCYFQNLDAVFPKNLFSDYL